MPAFPAPIDPKLWDDLTVMAATVYLEAEGELDKGKLAVAWVIRNRADQKLISVRDVCLAPWQFSCWNVEYRAQADERLINAHNRKSSWWAACAAFWRMIPDPTNGANHYLNVEVVMESEGHLPKWAEKGTGKFQIGAHTFMRA